MQLTRMTVFARFQQYRAFYEHGSRAGNDVAVVPRAMSKCGHIVRLCHRQGNYPLLQPCDGMISLFVRR